MKHRQMVTKASSKRTYLTSLTSRYFPLSTLGASASLTSSYLTQEAPGSGYRLLSARRVRLLMTLSTRSRLLSRGIIQVSWARLATVVGTSGGTGRRTKFACQLRRINVYLRWPLSRQPISRACLGWPVMVSLAWHPLLEAKVPLFLLSSSIWMAKSIKISSLSPLEKTLRRARSWSVALIWLRIRRAASFGMIFLIQITGHCQWERWLTAAQISLSWWTNWSWTQEPV